MWNGYELFMMVEELKGVWEWGLTARLDGAIQFLDNRSHAFFFFDLPQSILCRMQM